MNVNKHGLSRDIPLAVQREVRKRSKFGCVMCRCAIYQYEHIDPVFADAREHDPENICLLCGGCHDGVTRGRISKLTVSRKYREVQVSNDIKRPFEELDLYSNNVIVKLGTSVFEHTKDLIIFNGMPLFSLTPPDDGNSFPKLSGMFTDNAGKELFRITDNVWEGPLDMWDIEIKGTNLKIRTNPKHIALEINIFPPNIFEVTNLNMVVDNCHLVCTPTDFRVGRIHSSRSYYIGFGYFEAIGGRVGINIESNIAIPPLYSGLEIRGGEGVFLKGTGISLGLGAPKMIFNNLRILNI